MLVQNLWIFSEDVLMSRTRIGFPLLKKTIDGKIDTPNPLTRSFEDSASIIPN